MNLDFTISELCITTEPLRLEVADKLLKHIEIIQPIRDLIGMPIWASEKSGYRPVWYELQRNRSGNSEHTFKRNGAIDWTCRDMKYLVRLLKESKYKRVCYYPNHHFAHCDFKAFNKSYYICEDGINWIKQ
jgi:hypothetical protein